MGKTAKQGQRRDDTARIVADICGVSTRTVQMVKKAERNNELVLEVLVEYEIGKSALIKSLEKLVPIEIKQKRYARQKN